jgi:hypothetical protein
MIFPRLVNTPFCYTRNMLNENFVILGFVIQMSGSLKYLIATLQGRVKPNKVTFFLWALAPLIAFSAEIKQGDGNWADLITYAALSLCLVFYFGILHKLEIWLLYLQFLLTVWQPYPQSGKLIFTLKQKPAGCGWPVPLAHYLPC